MLLRKDVQSDIAQFHGCNQGRVVEIRQRKIFKDVAPMAPELLPAPGPYIVVDRVGHEQGQYAKRIVQQLREELRVVTKRFEDALNEMEGSQGAERSAV